MAACFGGLTLPAAYASGIKSNWPPLGAYWNG